MKISQAAKDFQGLLDKGRELFQLAQVAACEAFPDWQTMPLCRVCGGYGKLAGKRGERFCPKCGGWGRVKQEKPS